MDRGDGRRLGYFFTPVFRGFWRFLRLGFTPWLALVRSSLRRCRLRTFMLTPSRDRPRSASQPETQFKEGVAAPTQPNGGYHLEVGHGRSCRGTLLRLVAYPHNDLNY